MSPIQLALLTAGGLALLLAGPSQAATKRGDRPHAAASQRTRIAQPAAPRATFAPQPMVVVGDRVIGTDPDPRIRHELLRDLGAVFGGAD